MGQIKDKKVFCCFFVLLCLVFMQRFAIGISYHPVMDDWFLYGDIYTNKWSEFILPNEKFSIRPLAGAADMLFVSPLFKHLWAVELILTIVMAAGVFLILDTLKKNDFSAGGLFILLMCMLPMNMEATYWIMPFRQRRAVTAVISAVCTFVFAVSGIGQADMYRKISQTDTDIVSQMLELDEEKYITNINKNTYLLGAVHYYKNADSVEWYESIRGAAGGYADITGVMRHITGVSNTNNIMPVKDGDILNLGLYNASPQTCIFFALDEKLKVHNIYLREYESGYEVFYTDGEVYGYLNRTEENKYRLEIKG